MGSLLTILLFYGIITAALGLYLFVTDNVLFLKVFEVADKGVMCIGVVYWRFDVGIVFKISAKYSI